MIWRVNVGDQWYKIPATDLRVEGLGSNTVATFLDENGPVAVFNNPNSMVLIKDFDSNQ